MFFFQEKQAEIAKKKKQKREAAFVPAPEAPTPSRRLSNVKHGQLPMCLKVVNVI